MQRELIWACSPGKHTPNKVYKLCWGLRGETLFVIVHGQGCDRPIGNGAGLAACCPERLPLLTLKIWKDYWCNLKQASAPVHSLYYRLLPLTETVKSYKSLGYVKHVQNICTYVRLRAVVTQNPPPALKSGSGAARRCSSHQVAQDGQLLLSRCFFFFGT